MTEIPDWQVEHRGRRPRRPPRARPPSDYLTRRELLDLVPLSMSSIDSLEKRGLFPARFRLNPINRVVWKRREVVKFIEQRARPRP